MSVVKQESEDKSGEGGMGNGGGGTCDGVRIGKREERESRTEENRGIKETNRGEGEKDVY